MHFSAPIYTLKRQAKRLARDTAIPLHAALDRIAEREGFRGWSHLAATISEAPPAARIAARLRAGDMMLLGARPGHGKTLLALELAAYAPRLGRAGHVFTLDYHAGDVAARFTELGFDPRHLSDTVCLDTSDDISSAHIIDRLDGSGPALAVIDYLQLLDQRRTNPALAAQVLALAAFAHRSGAIIVALSQIDRAFDLSGRSMPGLADVRLPNPADLGAFNVTCFLHDGQVRMTRIR